jgi:hypothetical protein
MNWYKRYLLRKKAQQTLTPQKRRTVEPQPPPTPLSPPTRVKPNTQRPLTYHDLGDAGSEDHDNLDCEIFAWVWENGSLNVKEVPNANAIHSGMFPGIDYERSYSGRFNSCKSAAGINKPFRYVNREVPGLLIKQLIAKFSKYGIRQIWEYGDHDSGTLIWQG